MFKIQFIIVSILVVFVFNSCGDHEDNLHFTQDFVVDTIVILNYFDETEFENDTLPKLLQELGICDDTQVNDKSPCSPRNYKFFKYNKNLPWSDAFALEIRATVDGFALRRLILFERVNGRLAKTRGFVANLAEMHTTESGYNDLMLLFPDKEAGSFVVKFVYDENQKNYEFNSLEAIDGYLVKKERKDSLTNVVLQRLTENNMFF